MEQTELIFGLETNLTVTSLTALYIAYTHSAGAVYFSVGAVMCSLTVKAVKRIIKQPRPEHQHQRKVSFGCGHFFIQALNLR